MHNGSGSKGFTPGTRFDAASFAALPDSSQQAMLHMARLLSDGYSGSLSFTCNQGGVRDMRVDAEPCGSCGQKTSRLLRPRDLKHINQMTLSTLRAEGLG